MGVLTELMMDLKASLEKTEALTTFRRNIDPDANTTASKYLNGQLKSARSGH